MRAMRRVDGKWQVVAPANLYLWMCHQDGGEAVVIDDVTKTYYCATEKAAEAYRERWATENRRDDPRTSAMFFDLAVRLHAEGKK